MTEYELYKKMKLMHSGLSPDNIMQQFEVSNITKLTDGIIHYEIIKGGISYKFIVSEHDWNALKLSILRDDQIEEILNN